MERFHPGRSNAKNKQKQAKGPGWKDSIQVEPTHKNKQKQAKEPGWKDSIQVKPMQRTSKNKPKGLDGKIPTVQPSPYAHCPAQSLHHAYCPAQSLHPLPSPVPTPLTPQGAQESVSAFAETLSGFIFCSTSYAPGRSRGRLGICRDAPHLHMLQHFVRPRALKRASRHLPRCSPAACSLSWSQ